MWRKRESLRESNVMIFRPIKRGNIVWLVVDSFISAGNVVNRMIS